MWLFVLVFLVFHLSVSMSIVKVSRLSVTSYILYCLALQARLPSLDTGVNHMDTVRGIGFLVIKIEQILDIGSWISLPTVTPLELVVSLTTVLEGHWFISLDLPNICLRVKISFFSCEYFFVLLDSLIAASTIYYV